MVIGDRTEDEMRSGEEVQPVGHPIGGISVGHAASFEPGDGLQGGRVGINGGGGKGIRDQNEIAGCRECDRCQRDSGHDGP